MNPAATAGHAMSAYTSQNYGAGEYKRIRKGLNVCVGIAVVAYLILGSLMMFLPRQLGGILLSGSEQISLFCEFLPRCGRMLISVNLLFVIRSGVQGMGKPMIPLASGVVEMALRIYAISVYIGTIGFAATAYAEIGAWSGALFLNIMAYHIAISPLLKKDKSESIV